MSDSDGQFEKEKLHWAAARGDLVEVVQLVKSGFDVNAVDEALCFTPLHYAAREGHLEVMARLISLGADVNAYSEANIGETPLGDVAANCSYDVAKMLIDSGADPTIQGWMGNTAVHRASERKRPEGVKVYQLLLKTAESRFGYGN